MTDLKKPQGSASKRKSAAAGKRANRCLAQTGRKIAHNRRLSPARKSLAILHFRLGRKKGDCTMGQIAAKMQPKSRRTVTLHF
ncbi:hypothetical protein [Roseibium sp.]|uniref:hypothetical protein n=1 Tax=Roseibium sp. TaxID=1936156 RepID=UPI003BA8538A